LSGYLPDFSGRLYHLFSRPRGNGATTHTLVTAMFGKSLPSPVTRAAARFAHANRGNVAAMFAIALVPMIGIVGAAVDYSRAVAARSAMQAALDTTALMVSKDAQADPSMTAAQATAAAQKYFNALYKDGSASNVVINATYTPNTGKGASVAVTANGSVATDFMRMAGFTDIGIGTSSTTKWGSARLRIAMALDVTGSMASYDKLGKMKIAAKKLVDTLKASAKTADDVYLSIIPFNVMVNVGTDNKNANWLDWDTSYGSCSRSSYTTKSDCLKNGRTWTDRNLSRWQGCVTDRTQNYDTTNDAPTTNNADTLYLAESYSSCPASLLSMKSVFNSTETDSSNDTNTIKGKINSLTAVGNTNQSIGMQIAWMMLGSSLFPAPAKDPNYQYSDVIILLSDGENTQNRWYSNASQIDARQKLLCDNINPEKKDTSKKDTTHVYTIQVDTDGAGESAVLKYCADTGGFYPTTTTTGMAEAFSAIGNSLVKLQIAK
jgi:Flp pilus assembly protein TadG